MIDTLFFIWIVVKYFKVRAIDKNLMSRYAIPIYHTQQDDLESHAESETMCTPFE